METSFEWNEQKNQENQAKHDVSFEEAQDAFSDPNKRLIRDLDHSQVEERWFCLGEITIIRNGELFEGIVTVSVCPRITWMILDRFTWVTSRKFTILFLDRP